MALAPRPHLLLASLWPTQTQVSTAPGDNLQRTRLCPTLPWWSCSVHPTTESDIAIMFKHIPGQDVGGLESVQSRQNLSASLHGGLFTYDGPGHSGGSLHNFVRKYRALSKYPGLKWWLFHQPHPQRTSGGSNLISKPLRSVGSVDSI